MLLPLLRTEKMTSDYDRLADVYDGNFRTALDLAEDAGVRRQIVRAGAIKGAERILDIGCGTGLLLDWYPHLVHRYVGVDVSRQMLNVLERKHLKASVIHADVMSCRTAWPFGSAICTNGAVTYAGSPAAVAKKLKDLVRPGGRVFLHAYGAPYTSRQTYLRGQGGPPTWSAAEVKAAFPWATVRGFWRPSYAQTPAGFVGLLPVLSEIDSGTWGRQEPDEFYWLIVDGVYPLE